MLPVPHDQYTALQSLQKTDSAQNNKPIASELKAYAEELEYIISKSTQSKIERA